MVTPTSTGTVRSAGALEGIRVLQLASPFVDYAGKLFAELGAEVILVEPPGARMQKGHQRHTDGLQSEAQLASLYFNTSKRGITLDLDSPTGQAIFRSLCKSCHLVLEGERATQMQRRGLDFQNLVSENRSLVMTSITPFGQDGPYASYQSEDITLLALGGLLSLGGYADAAPVAAWGQQGYLAGSQFGAVAALMAVLVAEDGAAGQHVDVSIQECVVMALENAVQFHALEGTTRKRYGGEQREAGSGVFPCKDGEIFIIAGGIGATAFWANFARWMADEHVPEADALQGSHWTPPYRRTDEAKALFARVFGAYAASRTKSELYTAGQARRVPVCPVNTPRDTLRSAQLLSRGFFVDVPDAAGTPMTMPGAPYRLSATPWRLRSTAPTPGQDNQTVFGALGIDPSALHQLEAEGIV